MYPRTITNVSGVLGSARCSGTDQRLRDYIEAWRGIPARAGLTLLG